MNNKQKKIEVRITERKCIHFNEKNQSVCYLFCIVWNILLRIDFGEALFRRKRNVPAG